MGVQCTTAAHNCQLATGSWSEIERQLMTFFPDRLDARSEPGGAAAVRRHPGHHLASRRVLEGSGPEGEVPVPQRSVAGDRRGAESRVSGSWSTIAVIRSLTRR